MGRFFGNFFSTTHVFLKRPFDCLIANIWGKLKGRFFLFEFSEKSVFNPCVLRYRGSGGCLFLSFLGHPIVCSLCPQVWGCFFWLGGGDGRSSNLGRARNSPIIPRRLPRFIELSPGGRSRYSPVLLRSLSRPHTHFETKSLEVAFFRP